MFSCRKASVVVMLVLMIASLSRSLATTIIDLPLVYFESGKSFHEDSLEKSLYESECQKPVLEYLLSQLMKDRQHRYKVVGFTDDREYPKSQCTALSLRRAEYIRNWLIAHGVDEGQLSAPEGHGDIPIDDNNTEQGRLRNRRVEVDRASAEALLMHCPTQLRHPVSKPPARWPNW